jgi:hypothetical protein
MAFGKKTQPAEPVTAPSETAIAEVDERGLSKVALEESEFGALTRSPSEIHAIIETNVGPSGINMSNLTRIKIPTGGGAKWNVPSIRGEQTIEELEGIIIHQRDARAYWEKNIDEGGGGQPPDCVSEGGYNGIGDPGGACAECKFNVWGSEKKVGRGKACKELKIIYFLPKGKAFLPYVFILPPTSIKPISTYFLGLASEAIRCDSVCTVLKLKETTNQAGIKYAQVDPRLAKDGELSDAEIQVVRAYVAAIRPALERKVEVKQSELEGEEESS